MNRNATKVTNSETHQPVLVLLEKKAVVDHDLLKQWLGAYGYLAWDAVDIFHALEEIADFTVRNRPDVILLEVGSLADDYRTIRGIIDTQSDGRRQPVFALSDGDAVVNHKECFEGDVNQLKARLDRIIPQRSFARAAAV